MWRIIAGVACRAGTISPSITAPLWRLRIERRDQPSVSRMMGARGPTDQPTVIPHAPPRSNLVDLTGRRGNRRAQIPYGEIPLVGKGVLGWGGKNDRTFEALHCPPRRGGAGRLGRPWGSPLEMWWSCMPPTLETATRDSALQLTGIEGGRGWGEARGWGSPLWTGRTIGPADPGGRPPAVKRGGRASLWLRSRSSWVMRSWPVTWVPWFIPSEVMEGHRVLPGVFCRAKGKTGNRPAEQDGPMRARAEVSHDELWEAHPERRPTGMIRPA